MSGTWDVHQLLRIHAVTWEAPVPQELQDASSLSIALAPNYKRE